jgi:neutral ceramidase
MIVKRILKYFFLTIASLLAIIILFVFVSVIPVDRTPVHTTDFYQTMQNKLAAIEDHAIPTPQKNFTVGYAKVNLTPTYKTSTAGYGKRRGALFTSVHDSIYVRTMVISNGTEKIALVTMDMLIVPPVVTGLLKTKLPAIGFDLSHVYLSATHTHNSIGNWAPGLVGKIYAGSFDEALTEFIAGKILKSIVQADNTLMSAKIKAGTIPVANAVNNRLADKEGSVDSLLRVIEVTRTDSSRLVLTSFTAHATCLFSRDLQLSRDYPGKLVDELEKNGYTFAMFMAGAVGSHGCEGPSDGWERIEYLGKHIAHTMIDNKNSLKPVTDSTLTMINVPLELGEPQVKVLKNWRVRPWLFRAFFGDYPSSLTALRIGDVIMLGTPCDFSGELTHPIDSVAQHLGLRAMVTSFNGGYIGYITRDKFYDRDHYETQIMNWFGPGNGAYLSEDLIKMMAALSEGNE